MITTRFIGRLGNSMFQLAAAIGYARKYGYQWAAPVDARESSIHRVFPDLPKTSDHPRNYPRGGYDAEFYDYFDIPDLGPDLLLAGFFQSEKFFSNAKDEVKQVFKLDYLPEYEGYVSIHVRRGDYVQHSNSFPPITLEYIQAAINKLERPDKFVVMSDDIEWCKQNLNFDGHIIFSEGKNEREDLSIMASCSHHIIANSSFSWWGAYLGHNPDRVVVCPDNMQWYGEGNGVVMYARQQGIEPCKDLIPDGWIKIKI